MTRLSATFSLAALALAAALAPCALAQEGPITRMGTIDRIVQKEGGLYLEVAIEGTLAQPSNPELSTGVPDPSQIKTLSSPTTDVVPGMPVRLIIERSGAMFRPEIGSVESMIGASRCIVKVAPGALDQTIQDPSKGNAVHKIGDYLKIGARVAIWGVTTG